MILPRRTAVLAVILGTALVGGGLFLTLDLVPGLTPEAMVSLFPPGAVTAQIGHPVATFAADMKTLDIAAVVTALDHFAAANGFVRQQDRATTFQNDRPTHLRLTYTSPRAELSFYTKPDQAWLAIVSAPGRHDDLTSLTQNANEYSCRFALPRSLPLSGRSSPKRETGVT